MGKIKNGNQTTNQSYLYQSWHRNPAATVGQLRHLLPLPPTSATSHDLRGAPLVMTPRLVYNADCGFFLTLTSLASGFMGWH